MTSRNFTEVQPPGMVSYFANTTSPSGWLKCNGAAVSRVTYSDLFAAIGTTYGAGNGSTTFNLPNPRGIFIRGLADGRGVDSGRALNTNQVPTRFMQYTNGANLRFTDADLLESRANISIFSTGTNTGNRSQQNRGTRPRNMAFLVCIKF